MLNGIIANGSANVQLGTMLFLLHLPCHLRVVLMSLRHGSSFLLRQ